MLVFVAAALQAAAPSPPAPPPVHGGPQQMTCPVGGERFEAMVTGHYSTFGSRPDGRPYSYWFVPLPIPECPSNGLVVFRDFTAEQLATVTTLIASEEYRTMIDRDSTYYRAQWLATRIGLPERQALNLLLPAIWQVKPSSGLVGQPLPSAELARRYQSEFIARVLALPAMPDDPQYLVLYARAANEQRELGRFDEASTMIRQLRIWSRRTEVEDLAEFLNNLAAAVRRRDVSLEPLDAIPEEEVAERCMENTLPATEFNRRMCRRPEVQEIMQEIEEDRQLVEPTESELPKPQSLTAS